MPLALSLTTIVEKNKVNSDGAWLALLEIKFQEVTINLVRNTEPITWSGTRWQPFPFELSDIKEDSKGEIPTLTVKVGNQLQQMQKYVDILDGGIDAEVIIRIVNSNHLDIYEPDLEMAFTVSSTDVDKDWVYFMLGGDSNDGVRFPRGRIIKDFCPFKFKNIECGFVGAALSCSKTLVSCRIVGNSKRFGGESSIPLQGIYTSNT